MSRTRRAGAALSLVMLVMPIAGCGKAGRTDDVATSAMPLSSAVATVAAPDPGLANHPVVAAVKSSVVKIHGVAPGCQKTLAGSGFVVAPHRVMSNAHAVAGTESVSIEADGTKFDAHVVTYDPTTDMAILDVPGLDAPWLTFNESPAKPGTDALILGYPAGGPFVATPTRIRALSQLSGPDIYRTTTVSREVYIMRGSITAGVSGGPLVDLDGHVLGMAFGSSADEPETAFALTAGVLAPFIAGVPNTAAVATGACVN